MIFFILIDCTVSFENYGLISLAHLLVGYFISCYLVFQFFVCSRHYSSVTCTAGNDFFLILNFFFHNYMLINIFKPLHLAFLITANED